MANSQTKNTQYKMQLQNTKYKYNYKIQNIWGGGGGPVYTKQVNSVNGKLHKCSLHDRDVIYHLSVIIYICCSKQQIIYKWSAVDSVEIYHLRSKCSVWNV